MGMVSGEAYIMILILVNGLNLKHMATESIHGKTVTVMKVSGIWR
jgi:hypothetical protein